MNGGSARRDLFAGVTLSAMGLAVVALGSQHPIGTLNHMEAGFFPVALGVLLTGLGLAIGTGGLLVPSEATDALDAIQPPDIRGCAAIVLSIVAFVGLGKLLGLVPATFAAALIAAAGDRQTTVRGALALATALVAIAVVLFSYLLKVPFPLVRW